MNSSGSADSLPPDVDLPTRFRRLETFVLGLIAENKEIRAELGELKQENQTLVAFIRQNGLAGPN